MATHVTRHLSHPGLRRLNADRSMYVAALFHLWTARLGRRDRLDGAAEALAIRPCARGVHHVMGLPIIRISGLPVRAAPRSLAPVQFCCARRRVRAWVYPRGADRPLYDRPADREEAMGLQRAD